ncbi:hypothetical protein TEA_000368 [Camellia sinensis var. sinensis]|uniref:Enoyl reductase (ER) domain-containing protein n=1 Tax=Camellia sinensis var. sinensis TaxID=542762 RepID=A0A4S4DVL6_CAMSN|nr:hypothetical protein TEA_000368 [Camellia sinensis var. sinensis]
MEKTPEQEHPVKAFGWAASDPSGLLSPSISPEGDHEVTLKVLYCGICHSDLHVVRNEWARPSTLVPGQKLKVGDKGAVWVLQLDSCRSCAPCATTTKAYCFPKQISTFVFHFYALEPLILGGFSDIMVVMSTFVLCILNNLPLMLTAPTSIVAGITVYSPLKYFELDKPGMHKKEAIECLGADSSWETGDHEVTLKVLYCGICHSDLHVVKNEWGTSKYPLVPGHEIVGVVTKVGNKVQKLKVGDKGAVGCFIGSCRSCNHCANNQESYCPKQISTLCSTYYDGTTSYGGFSDIMVCDEHFVLCIPDNLPLDATAPLLCAGITVYSPLKYFELDKPGMHVGVVGLGGLGHLAVKFAKAFGVKVTVISTSPGKKKEAIECLGADSFLVSRDNDQMEAAIGTMDGIIDTVSGFHSLLPLLNLLKSNGKLILVGISEKPLELPAFPLLTGRKMVAGSASGGLKETQEMIDFAAEHNISSDIEVIPMDYVNTAMERLAKGDVKYRFVIDIGNTLHAT